MSKWTVGHPAGGLLRYFACYLLVTLPVLPLEADWSSHLHKHEYIISVEETTWICLTNTSVGEQKATFKTLAGHRNQCFVLVPFYHQMWLCNRNKNFHAVNSQKYPPNSESFILNRHSFTSWNGFRCLCGSSLPETDFGPTEDTQIHTQILELCRMHCLSCIMHCACLV